MGMCLSSGKCSKATSTSGFMFSGMTFLGSDKTISIINKNNRSTATRLIIFFKMKRDKKRANVHLPFYVI